LSNNARSRLGAGGLSRKFLVPAGNRRRITHALCRVHLPDSRRNAHERVLGLGRGKHQFHDVPGSPPRRDSGNVGADRPAWSRTRSWRQRDAYAAVADHWPQVPHGRRRVNKFAPRILTTARNHRTTQNLARAIIGARRIWARPRSVIGGGGSIASDSDPIQSRLKQHSLGGKPGGKNATRRPLGRR
jgi:hypothetical protein